MRSYELILVFKTSLSETNREKALEKIKELLRGAKIIKEQNLGQKPLSYSIKKESAGFYVDLVFEMEEGIPKEFEKKLILNDNILRHLLLRSK